MKMDSHEILQTMKLNTMMNLKTGDPITDLIISLVFTSCAGALFNYMVNIFDYINISSIIKFWKGRMANEITIEGKRVFRSNNWSSNVSTIWSRRFEAIWDHINNDLNYQGITSLKEITGSIDTYVNSNKGNTKDDNIFIVDQNLTSFALDNNKNIFANVKSSDNTGDSDKMIEVTGRVETIRISIYSYKLSLSEIKDFIEHLTKKYNDKLEQARLNNKYIYSLNYQSNNDDGSKINWLERPFISTRRFENLYFDEKEKLIKKIDFFINNKSWYEKEGHPYTLGIGLSGPPGTGKTSIIKCIANKLKRHLIQIPLNKIQNEDDFYKAYFESTYSKKNCNNTIDFNNKIIVFEDIDCMTDLVLDRENKNTNEKMNEHTNDNLDNMAVLESLVDMASSKDNNANGLLKNNNGLFKNNNGKLTLSFILNLLDGLDENQGRILIITSNYYDKIDKALIRPGRIDLQVEMKNASVNTIKEMYAHYYDSKIPAKYLSKIKDEIVSPAELVNFYRTSDNSKEFIQKILDKHV
jgi:SpoVK/Ycf46/Vps4 family AAA+-type ATPase